MGRCLFRGAVAFLMLAGCAGPRAPEGVIRGPAGNFVRLAPDPGTAGGGANAHPAIVPPERLRPLLAAIEVESPAGPFIGERVMLPLFDPDDLAFLVPAITKALAEAEPHERLVFYLRQRGRLLRPEVTTGAMAVRGASLSITLGHYRRTDVEGSEDENLELQIQEELRADPLYGVHDVGVRLSVRPDRRWQQGDGPRTVVLPF